MSSPPAPNNVADPLYNNASRPPPVSSPASPYLTPQLSYYPSSLLSTPGKKRLLIPATRRFSSSSSPKSLPMKSSPNKISRSKSGSTSVLSSPEPAAVIPRGTDWVDSSGINFEVVEEQIEMEGYELYAVEKWVVDRAHPVTVLVVYTGDPKHKISVTAFAPIYYLSPNDSQAEWEKMIDIFRRNGARPKETSKGVLMVTSLANFRPDLTIVRIWNVNFPEVWEQLHANINLLRMGCSGRSALTLQEPSDTTKDRFIALYHIQDKARSKELFNATVLELVRFIQSSLTIFGILDTNLERDGLLCNFTVDAIQRWIIEIGQPFVHVEPTERFVDPSIFSAILSLVLTMRNKLADIGFGQAVPRDPFLDPLALVRALTAFHNSRNNTSVGSNLQFATGSMIEALDAAHDKFRLVGSYKVHRVLKSKLGDLTTDLRTAPNSPSVSAHMPCATQDLSVFVKAVLNGKDGAASLRYLWSGRPLDIHETRKGQVQSDGEKEDEFDKEKYEKIDGKSTDDEPDLLTGIHWSGRVQKKIESWAALGRGKKLSVDFGSKEKSWVQHPGFSTTFSTTNSEGFGRPTVIVSRENEDVMSSGQTSPVLYQGAPSSWHGVNRSFTAENSVANLTEYNRQISEFDQKYPHLRYPTEQRIVTWSDPVSMRGMTRRPSRSNSSTHSGRVWDESSDMSLVMKVGSLIERKHSIYNVHSHRRKSFSDSSSIGDGMILPLDRMKIDVELCGQLLIMRRREVHLKNAVACLKDLISSLSETNTHLGREHEVAYDTKLKNYFPRSQVLDDVEDTLIGCERIKREKQALQYESDQFQLEHLWHMANIPRQKVFELREKIFGTGRRLPQAVGGSRSSGGRFDRVQWTLDGQGRLVDWLGRTESEAEEESELEDAISIKEDEEGEDVVEHPDLKPTWLLKLFSNWGTRWSAGTGAMKKNDGRSPLSSGPSSPTN